MKSLPECCLYTFVDTGFLHGRRVEDIARDLCQGGSDIIQLRAKQSARGEVKSMASAILPVTRKAGIPLVINDHADVAAEIGAEFCHLGQEDFFGAGRTHVSDLGMAGKALRVGLSSHSPAEAQRAIAAGAAYLGVGPVYATGTKPEASPVTLEYVSWAAKNVSIPWFAIGGINLPNLDDVLQAGARGICVVSAILNSRDVAAACREFKRRLEAVR
jgi:thiamine-phosphate pyrophosphorylase